MTRAAIDLNGDLGEGSPHDAELLKLVSSANVCCGLHAGSDELMAATVRLAIRHGVAVGAHPGHADRDHFGRRELAITPADAVALVARQVDAVAAVAGAALHHVKLHGGLYHQVGREPALAEALADWLADRWPRLVVYAPEASCLAIAARGRGLAVAAEAFIDRRYRADGALAARSQPQASIDDPADAATQAVRLATGGLVRTLDGADIRVAADTLCVHGDGPRAVEIATAACRAVLAAGIAIRPA
jgi:5-oxoprolinase (ATP-hydrolysing) subunit A